MLNESIKKLVQYGIETGLTPDCEKNYTTNLLLDILKKMNMQSRKKSIQILIWRKC